VTVSTALETRLLRTSAPGASAIQLGILEKRPAALDPGRPPVLLLHGATLAGRLFDLPRADYSLMAALAGAGRAVYALDVRGFGTSLGGAVMEAPPSQHPPFAGVDEAVKDVAAAVDVILARHPAAALDLVGFSWGAVVAARFAGDNPGKVARLALYAPLYEKIDAAWLGDVAGGPDRRPLGAYRLVTLEGLIRRWNGDLPAADASAYREDGIPELVFAMLAALDPSAPSRRPPAFRCPNGPLADIGRICSGEQLYDPARLTMPTLLVRGDDDTTSTHAAAVRLLAAIASPGKRYRVIAPGSHFLCIEKNRTALYEHLNDFFAPLGRAAQT
jgi:alpha-beta hydrolase superfamily lysophospholipase